MGLTRAADIGFAFAAGRRSPLLGPSASSAPVIGYTSTSVITNDIQEVNAGAARLESLMKANVKDAPLLAAWAAWYADWQAFFDYHQSQLQKFNALFYSDTLAAQVNAKSKQLAAFYSDYNRLRAPGSPAVAVPDVKDPKAEDKAEETKWSIPWWGWMIGGAVVVGAGYLAYRKAQQLSRVKTAIQTNVLPHFIGEPLAKAAATRDPAYPIQGSPELGPTPSGYEHGIPLSIDDVANHPRAIAYSYRPYEHPHVVMMRDRALAAKRLRDAAPRPSLEDAIAADDPSFFDRLDEPSDSHSYDGYDDEGGLEEDY